MAHATCTETMSVPEAQTNVTYEPDLGHGRLTFVLASRPIVAEFRCLRVEARDGRIVRR